MVILFVFGAIIGSFLNVLSLRLNSGLSLAGRSSCASCRKKLSWKELFPILSFLWLRGRCRECKTRISWQYPAVELWTGLIFASVFSFDKTLSENIIVLLVFCLYVSMVAYDVRHKIIPNSLVYTSVVCALLLRVVTVGDLWDWFSGPILFSFFGLIWLVSRGRAMGFGDAKLALSAGLLLGLSQGLSAIVLSFWIGAIYGVSIIFLNRFNTLLNVREKITIKSEIPFAPFMVAGAWFALIFNLDLLHVNLW